MDDPMVDELMVKVLAGTATEIEARIVDRWRGESAGNERAFQETARLWALTGQSGEPGLEPPATARIVAEAEERRRRGRRGLRAKALLRSPWLGYGLAAAAVAGFLLLRAGAPEGTGAGGLTPVGSSSLDGHAVTMSLSDGSVMRLAPGAQADFAGSTTRREVVLRGTAFFAVAPGAVPFVVRTPSGEATVVGTRFEVRADAGETRLIVVEGVVRLAGEGGEVEVEVGEAGYLAGRAAPRVVGLPDVWAELAWTEDLMVFRGTRMADVGVELARHFGRTVEVAPELRERRITAWFEGESVDEVVSAVCVVVGARCLVGDSTVVIEAR